MKLFYVLFLCSLFLTVIGKPSIEQKPLVVVTCMYNNQEWVLKNLSMIFAQRYSNFRVIIVDDGSTDETVSRIERYLTENNLWGSVTFIKNDVRKRKLFNLYRALYMVDDQEIVVIIDGDDWLADQDVFFYLNMLYEEDIWFTYGQYENVPEYQAAAWGFNAKGYARPVPKEVQKNQTYRKGPFYYMHLRTFRGWLFKLVKLKDLISESVGGFIGKFFPASNDLAMYYPMVEMAHKHIRFVDKVIYTRNLYSPLVGFKVDRSIQCASGTEVKKRMTYKELKAPVYRDFSKIEARKVHILLWVDRNGVLSANAIKQSLKCVQENSELIIVYDTAADKAALQVLQKKFTHIKMIECTSLENGITQCIAKMGSDYLYVMCNPSKRIVAWQELCQAVYQLERTYAVAICLTDDSNWIDEHSMPITLIDDSFYACKLCFYDELMVSKNRINGFLVRAKDLKCKKVAHKSRFFDTIDLFHETTDDILLFFTPKAQIG